jgi:hypothetical protein
MNFFKSVYRHLAKPSSQSRQSALSKSDIESPLLDEQEPLWIEDWSSPDTLDANWITVNAGGGFGNQELQCFSILLLPARPTPLTRARTDRLHAR